MIWVKCISKEVLNESNELVDILLHGGSLFDVEELSEEKFMLIMAETVTDQATESNPIDAIKGAFDGL